MYSEQHQNLYLVERDRERECLFVFVCVCMCMSESERDERPAYKSLVCLCHQLHLIFAIEKAISVLFIIIKHFNKDTSLYENNKYLIK